MASSAQAPDSRPLCVDLDGSLIRSDLLYESILLLVRANFFSLFLLPLWLMRGKAHLKMQIARRVQPDVRLLPYRLHVLEMLKEEKAKGRKIILVTASPLSFARAVADHLGFFDAVEASSTTLNLSGQNKADHLTDAYGKGGFDYLGNGGADYPVWDEARYALIVGRDAAALRYANNEHARYIAGTGTKKPTWQIWGKAIRVHQWLKNSLLFVPAILSSEQVSLGDFPALVIAFLSFSLCSSSVYLLNDLLDIEADRKHRSKFARPIAAGLISPPKAIIAAGLFIILAFALSLVLPWQFTAALGTYLATTSAYSLYLKRLLLIDIITLAGLFAIRVLAGAEAIASPISTWLLAFCMFFFLSLAMVKRFVELNQQMAGVGRKDTGRGYQLADLETLAQGGIASGFASVVVLALFIDSPQMVENYPHPEMIWLVCPLVLYLVVRIWILARREEMNDDPVVFLMIDWRSQLMIGAGAAIMIVAQML